MKICWDNLEKLRYNPKTGKWYKGTNSYVYMDSCEHCKEPFLKRPYSKGRFCNKDCENSNRDLIGKKYGRLTIIKNTKKVKHKKFIWLCQCDCGNKIETIRTSIIQGLTKSCGCLHKEVITKHYHGYETPTYRSWKSMKQRCFNKNSKGYEHYGGRGITVCRRWINSFENFLADMGERPEGKTLDRIDNDGPYGPWNCRWASKKEQFENSRIENINGRFENNT